MCFCYKLNEGNVYGMTSRQHHGHYRFAINTFSKTPIKFWLYSTITLRSAGLSTSDISTSERYRQPSVTSQLLQLETRKENLHLYHSRQSPPLPVAAARPSVLTSRRKAPNARQNTSGPAKSASCRMDASVMRNGFRTARVCKEQRRTVMLENVQDDIKHFITDFQISTIILKKTPTPSIRPRSFHKNRHNK